MSRGTAAGRVAREGLRVKAHPTVLCTLLRVSVRLVAPVAAVALAVLAPTTATSASCTPTREDALGPYYVPGAPVRAKTGSGYVLTGVVRSAATCRPIAGAKIELWNAGPDGEYASRWRATTYSKANGSYRYETGVPPPYSGRPPHIHLRVSARGHTTLVTQHYPKAGATSARFPLVLVRR